MELEAGSGKAARRTGRLNNDRGPARMLTENLAGLLDDMADHAASDLLFLRAIDVGGRHRRKEPLYSVGGRKERIH